MDLLTDRLNTCRQNGRLAFMAHVYCGDPDLGFSRKLIGRLRPHVDVLELGIPFTDPLADGAVFQAACRRALDNGTRVEHVFKTAADIRREDPQWPILITTYYNIIHRMGTAAFARRLKELDLQGVIVPDLPVEESNELNAACRQNELHLIQLVAPTTTPKRLKKILDQASGFVYVVSQTGVTGSGGDSDQSLRQLLAEVNAATDLPLLLGFGISQPEQVAGLDGIDGFIIGSAIARLYAGEESRETALEQAGSFAARFSRLSRGDD